MMSSVKIGTYYRDTGSLCELTYVGGGVYNFAFIDRDDMVYEQWNLHDFTQQRCEDWCDDWALEEET
tara:strand:+ start:666 stop:866 length:201 start_codon:yes stop_codon:yes gene_type:complete